MTKDELVKAVRKMILDSGADPDDGVPLEELSKADLIEEFKELGGYDPMGKAKGGMMNKPRKMSNGGMMNKGTKVRGQGAAIRGTKFKGVF